MRYFLTAFFLGALVLPGCGGAGPEEADTSHLSAPPKEAEDAAAAARAKYDSAGKEGPAQ